MYDTACRSRGEGAADGGRGRFQVAAGGEVEERGGGGVGGGRNQPPQLRGSLTEKTPVASNNAEVELWFLFPPLKLKHSAVQ